MNIHYNVQKWSLLQTDTHNGKHYQHSLTRLIIKWDSRNQCKRRRWSKLAVFLEIQIGWPLYWKRNNSWSIWVNTEFYFLQNSINNCKNTRFKTQRKGHASETAEITLLCQHKVMWPFCILVMLTVHKNTAPCDIVTQAPAASAPHASSGSTDWGSCGLLYAADCQSVSLSSVVRVAVSS